MLPPGVDCRGQIVKKSDQYCAQINYAEMVKFLSFHGTWSKIHDLAKKFAKNFVSDHGKNSEVSVAMVTSSRPPTMRQISWTEPPSLDKQG